MSERFKVAETLDTPDSIKSTLKFPDVGIVVTASHTPVALFVKFGAVNPVEVVPVVVTDTDDDPKPVAPR